jgi:hypothetical protein
MPPSVHTILIHGYLAIKYTLVPTGQLSEEAQDSRNKDYISRTPFEKIVTRYHKHRFV